MTPCTYVCAYVLPHVCWNNCIVILVWMIIGMPFYLISFFFFFFFAPLLILRRVQVGDVGQNLIVEVADKVGSII